MEWPFLKRRVAPADAENNARPVTPPDAWARYLADLQANGLSEPGKPRGTLHRPATLADEQALYDVSPSFADLLPWVEYLPESKCMLLEDGACQGSCRLSGFMRPAFPAPDLATLLPAGSSFAWPLTSGADAAFSQPHTP
ncbi:hypothetical protein, partial [Serratia ficaria]